MKRKFITFADSRMTGALRRIRKQAEELGVFDEIEALTEKDLDESFREKYSKYLKGNVRGFGWWIWKPYIIHKELIRLQDGDQLIYIDAGCHINPRGRKRFIEYMEILAANPIGIAAFELDSNCSEYRYSKMDLIAHLGVKDNSNILKRGQLCTGHIFLVKNEQTVNFVYRWLQETLIIPHVDDSPSILENDPQFIEHRHEQSVFSIMCKLHGAASLPGGETWPRVYGDWKSLSEYPIWDKRDLGISSHLIFRTWRKIRKIWKNIQRKWRKD
ncbi:MAG: hypothetical protein IJZ68_01065 [Bacteroidaceae bacterium]|nr:hypothetical protein [Bacteroidaceae bacterium]